MKIHLLPQKKIVQFLLIGVLIALICVFLYLFVLRKPSNNRDWETQYKILPRMTITNEVVGIKDFRDYTYDAQGHGSFSYIDRAIPISDITNVWFVVEPFGRFHGIAHTYFSFDVKDQDPVVVSVEARRINGQTYSSIRGLFNNYGLMYIWATERDVTLRRVLEQHNVLYMYPVQIPQVGAQRLFLQLAETTHDLETHPSFYNTLTSNCTSELAKVANRTKPGTIPFDKALILTGYSPELLHELKLIPADKPLDEINKRYDITEMVKRAAATDNFSSSLRRELGV